MPKTILKHAIVAIAIIMAVITTIVYLQSTGAKSKKQVIDATHIHSSYAR